MMITTEQEAKAYLNGLPRIFQFQEREYYNSPVFLLPRGVDFEINEKYVEIVRNVDYQKEFCENKILVTDLGEEIIEEEVIYYICTRGRWRNHWLCFFTLLCEW